MLLLLKILLSFYLFLFSFSSPILAAGNCIAPRPENIDILIKQAQARGGAAALVPAKVLKAIYIIEGMDPGYIDPDKYTCKKNSATALGLMQIVDEEYKKLVPQNQQISDEHVCQVVDCKLSRCNPIDAIEISARALLDKIFLWNQIKDEPFGKITTKEDVFYAACRYYGSFTPDNLTNNLTDWLSPNKIPPDGQLSYCEFVCAYSGFCSSPSSYPPRTDAPHSGRRSSVKWKFDACTQSTVSPTPINFTYHPLRPFPNQPITENPPLTEYCAMRPTAVQQNQFDVRDKLINLKAQGNLTQDFSQFITPLLSITDPSKPDYSLPFNDKAQRYLLDYLEGRAYYEPFPETAPKNQTETADLFNRLGVFRKLAPQSYQDELKIAVIDRANKKFDPSNNPYGFQPASKELHNYVVGYWDGQKVTNQGKGQKVTLKDFFDHKKPLAKDYPNDQNLYQNLYQSWLETDNGKWYQLWPYVPMFTREDTKGYIEIVDSNGQPSCPGSSCLENNTSTTNKIEVIHPHLARAYEVSTALSYLLTPQSLHLDQPPKLQNEWTPKAWEDEGIWWLDPSYQKPHSSEYDTGPMCDIDPEYISLISSSGDKATDGIFSTSVNRQDLGVPNPKHYRCSETDSCGTHHCCAVCKYNPSQGGYFLDESSCYYYQDIRANPNYLITYTPFLTQIMTSLSQGPRAIFDLFQPRSEAKEKYEIYDWPGVGNAGEESPQYSFSQGQAEAGYRKPGDSQSYYYRYLGSIQCAKETVMSILQPFITGQAYEPYALECFPSHDIGSLARSTTTGPINLPRGIPGEAATELEFSNTSSSPIARTAYEIVNSLTRGTWNYWNVSPAHPYALYWCTWLVVDAFNANGGSIPEPTRTNGILYTPTMVAWFQNQGKYLDANTITLNQVQPGYAVFFKVLPGHDNENRLNHAAIVYEVIPGQGFRTVESNAGYKTMFYPVDDNGHFIPVSIGDKTITVEGFGVP